MTVFKIILGDITNLTFDAIVNAANTSLLGGGGVDGAIHKACGPKLLDECKNLKGCQTGNSKLTRSYNLKNNNVYWIIHTVGPIFRNIGSEEKYLRSAYNSALKVAQNYAEIYKNECDDFFNSHLYKYNTSSILGVFKKDNKLSEINKYINSHPIKTIGFPSISTGAYSFPLKEACSIAINEILSFIKQNPDTFDEITMVCYDQKTYDMFQNLYSQIE